MEIVKLLVDRGADVICDNSLPYLFMCASSGDDEIVRCLVDKGADVNCPGTEPMLPTYVTSGNTEMVRYVLEKGANPDGAGSSRRSPLYCAADGGYDAWGANPNPKSRKELLPVYAAICNDHRSILVQLLKHGARVEKDQTIENYLYSMSYDQKPERVATGKLIDQWSSDPEYATAASRARNPSISRLDNLRAIEDITRSADLRGHRQVARLFDSLKQDICRSDW
jgi:ankyrin repeat protein